MDWENRERGFRASLKVKFDNSKIRVFAIILRLTQYHEHPNFQSSEFDVQFPRFFNRFPIDSCYSATECFPGE